MSNEMTTNELINKFDKLATEYTPQVIDAAMTAIQISAIGSLIGGILALIAAYFAGKYALKYAKESEETNILDMDTDPFMIFISLSVFAMFSGLLAVLTFFDIWIWVTLFNPELGLAHKILGL